MLSCPAQTDDDNDEDDETEQEEAALVDLTLCLCRSVFGAISEEEEHLGSGEFGEERRCGQSKLFAF